MKKINFENLPGFLEKSESAKHYSGVFGGVVQPSSANDFSIAEDYSTHDDQSNYSDTSQRNDDSVEYDTSGVND